jgi:hypothetical protein
MTWMPRVATTLSAEEIEHVRNTAQEWREESKIEFVCLAAEKRGNSYSRAEISELLTTGMLPGGKQFSDARMAVELSDAYDSLFPRSARRTDGAAKMEKSEIEKRYGIKPKSKTRIPVRPVPMDLSGEAGRRVVMAAARRVMATHADVLKALAKR